MRMFLHVRACVTITSTSSKVEPHKMYISKQEECHDEEHHCLKTPLLGSRHFTLTFCKYHK